MEHPKLNFSEGQEGIPPSESDLETLSKNMDLTTWFQNMAPNALRDVEKRKLYPTKNAELAFFIKQMDLLKIFPKINIKYLTHWSPTRLDALYLILKYSNLEVVKFCEDCTKLHFIPEFEFFFYSKMGASMEPEDRDGINSYLEEFYADFSRLLIYFLKFDVDEAHVTNSIVTYCLDYLASEYSEMAMCQFQIVPTLDIFDQNTDIFEKKIARPIIEIKQKMKPAICNIILGADHLLTNSDDQQLMDQVLRFIDPNLLHNMPSDAINHFIKGLLSKKKKRITKLSEYSNFLFELDHKYQSYLNAFWLHNEDDFMKHFMKDLEKQSKESAKENAQKIGMNLFPEEPIPNILQLFVLHELVKDQDQLLSMILSTMEKYRSVPRIYSKYDDSTVEYSYMITCMGHDLTKTYDEYLADLTNKILCPEIPIEFVLRIISFVLNSNIKYYNQDMIELYINNSTQSAYPDILIYEASYAKYYLLYPMGQEFVPLKRMPRALNSLVSTKNSKVLKIVEV